MDGPLSAEGRMLIAVALPSAEHIDVLHHVCRSTGVSVDALVAKTRLDVPTVGAVLRDLHRSRLIIERAGLHVLTNHPVDRRIVEELVSAYEAHPTLVIRAIFSRVPPPRFPPDAA